MTTPSSASDPGLQGIQQERAASVARYYDQNTPRFLRYGGSGETAAIHRPIWAPGVQNTEEAFLYLNKLVAHAIEPAIRDHLRQEGRSSQERAGSSTHPPGAALVLDLGCGAGGVTTWLAQHLNPSGKPDLILTGVTNSDVQVELARSRARQLGLEERCRFLLADFMALPQLEEVQAAFAIESFVHAPDAARFFEQIGRQLVPGGRLVICDDFLANDSVPSGSQAAYWLARFQKNWHIHNLLTPAAAAGLARQKGFALLETSELTPYIRHFHPLPLRLIAWVTRLPLRLAYWQNLSGGMALQICIQKGWTGYLAQVYRKE